METTAKQTRQILMNELGLTRDTVREMVRETVERLVQKAIDHHMANGDGKSGSKTIEELIEEAISQRISRWNGDRTALQALVAKSIADQVKTNLIDRIKISI